MLQEDSARVLGVKQTSSKTQGRLAYEKFVFPVEFILYPPSESVQDVDGSGVGVSERSL